MVTEKYKALIESFPLVPIKNDAHLDDAHKAAQSLMLRSESVTTDEAEYLEVLLDQIAKYESKHHPLKIRCCSTSYLKFLPRFDKCLGSGMQLVIHNDDIGQRSPRLN